MMHLQFSVVRPTSFNLDCLALSVTMTSEHSMGIRNSINIRFKLLELKV